LQHKDVTLAGGKGDSKTSTGAGVNIVRQHTTVGSLITSNRGMSTGNSQHTVESLITSNLNLGMLNGKQHTVESLITSNWLFLWFRIFADSPDCRTLNISKNHVLCM